VFDFGRPEISQDLCDMFIANITASLNLYNQAVGDEKIGIVRAYLGPVLIVDF